MAWYDTHQAAVDPDNPAANEQITFDEWNAMVSYLKDKIIDKAVNDAAIGNDKVLVYKTATSTFVFEAQTGGAAAINDLTDVTISGVPADNEVLAYDTGTSEWINQTAAEAGLATVAGLASYLALAGGTMAGNLNMGDYLIDDVDDIQAYDTGGIAVRDSAAASKIVLATTTYAFTANATGNMGSQNLINVLDPTSAQHASTKNYDDTHLFTKEIVTSFTDGYVPVYRTASGKFEMEDGGGAAGLPVVDTTSIVKGSADGTKLMRLEVDGITTGTTRVMTVPDKDITLCDTAEVMLLSGTQAMTADMGMGYHDLDDCGGVYGGSILTLQGGAFGDYGGRVLLYADSHITYPGLLLFSVPNAAKTSLTSALAIEGVSDTPIVDVYHGLDMNAKNIIDIADILPDTASTRDIGSSALPWGDMHVDGTIYFEQTGGSDMTGVHDIHSPTGITMMVQSHGNSLDLVCGSGGYIRIFSSPKNMSPMWDDDIDLGQSSYRWQNIYGVTGIFDRYNMGTSVELTIASGVVTATQSYHKIDTESDDATDNLDTISGGTIGDVLIISPQSDARTVVVKNNAINGIYLSGSDFTMDSEQDLLTLFCTTTNVWTEISRSNNGA